MLNIFYIRRPKSTNNVKMCVEHHYTQTHTNNVNKLAFNFNYNTLLTQWYLEGWYLTHIWTNFHDRVISLKGLNLDP